MRIYNKIFNAFSKKRSEAETSETRPEEAVILRLQSEISGLKLTISELQLNFDDQKVLLEESYRNKEKSVTESTDARIQQIFVDLISPLAQLNLLKALAAEGKEIQNDNIFKLVAIIESTLEDYGLKPIHTVSQQCLFDPECMHPIKSNLSFTQKEIVIVRLPGYSFKEKIISKSLVDKA